MGMRGSYYKSLEIQLMTSLETIKTGIAKYYDFTAGLPILFLNKVKEALKPHLEFENHCYFLA